MPSHSKQDEFLTYQFLIFPGQFGNRWDHAADCELRRILFKCLAADRDDYLRLFFPNGVPPDQSEPWVLRSAQGAADGAEYLPSAKGTACGRIFKSGESTYICKTCAMDDTCVLCARCFDSSDHEGHQVYVSVSPGNSGCCDCGDKEAWRREIICSIHTDTSSLPWARQASGKEKDKQKSPMHTTETDLPRDLVEAIRMTISRAVDYLCDVFSCSPEQMRLPKTEQSIRRDEELSRLSGDVYGAEVEVTGDSPEFALVLWNDEKHTMDDVKNQVARACQKTKRFGFSKALEVNDVGRSVVHYSRDVQELLKMAGIIEQLKLTVTIRSSRDTFREQMCATIIDWIADISDCAVGGEPHLLRNIVREEFLQPWRTGSEAGNKFIGVNGIDDHETEDNEKRIRGLRLRGFNIAQPPIFPRIELEFEETGDEDDLDGNDEGGDEIEDEEEDIEMDEEDMEVDIEDLRNAAHAAMNVEADMDIDFADDDNDVTEVREAAIAGYPAPPLPPAATQGPRRRILTPADSEDGEADQSRPTSNAPFESVPRTPHAKGLLRRTPRPSRHWLEKPEGFVSPPPSEPCEDLWQRVRLDWLILYDLRLWKVLRTHLRHLYIKTVITNPHFKRILGLRFAGLYTLLAELYLIADREPDHSIINLSAQILTTPTITAEVVERGNFLTNLMAILYTFLTTRQVGYPEEVNSKATLAFDAGTVTNRRMFHFFLDLRWLFQSEYIHHKLRTEPRYLLQFLDLVKLHQGICPNVRATGEHVEYESDAWISASLIIKEIDKLCRQVAISFEPKPDLNDNNVHLQRAIRTVAQVTMINSFGFERKRFQQAELKADLTWHTVGPFVKLYSVPRHVVQTEPMSFHHPLHYLLSWLLENAKGMGREEIHALLRFSPADLKDPFNVSRNPQMASDSLRPDELLSAIFDHPLRVCSWLAQTKAGMWVRNGITLRHQANSYRSVANRDIGYQRDIFMIQAGLVLVGSEESGDRPGELFLAQMIDRFQMANWVRGDYAVVLGFEESQQLDVIEDFFHLLVIALSERGNLIPGQGESREQADRVLQHDIAHALCFKPLSFSDLSSRVTEKVGESDDFNRVLDSMTTYRAPEGLSDTGTFELKPEYLELVDPYFAHYTRNLREEAENVYRKHMARKTNKKPEEIVYEPKLQPIEAGLFKDLASFTRTRLFGQVVFAALDYAVGAKVAAPNMQATRIETFLHMVLHLMLVTVLEDAKSNRVDGFVAIAAAGWHNKAFHAGGGTIVGRLVALSDAGEYASCHPTIRHILLKMHTQQPDKLRSSMGALAGALDRAEAGSPASISAEDKEKKKQAALARQARVMAQMKQQQNSFLMNQGLAVHDDDDDDDDDGFEDLEDDMSITQEQDDLAEQKKLWSFPSGTCILCQEETDDQRLFGTFAFLGESNALRYTPVEDPDYVREVLATPESLDRSADGIRPFGVAGKNKYNVEKTAPDGSTSTVERQGLSKGFPQHTHSIRSPVSTSCGHIMHFSCFELYAAATARRHAQQIARNHPERTELKEFICPLCKALGNTFLPIIWRAKECANGHELHASKDFSDWLVESPSVYAPDVSFLDESRAMTPRQQQSQDVYAERSSQYVRSMFTPSLVASMRDLSISSPQTPHAQPRYSLRRGYSFSSIFRIGRPEGGAAVGSSDASQTGVSPSGSEQPPRMAELLKAYQRADDTVRVNRLSSSGRVDDGTMHPIASLARAFGATVSAIEIQHRGTCSDSLSTSLLADLSEQTITHLRILSESIESYLAVNILRPSPVSVVAPETVRKRDTMTAQLFGLEGEITMIKLRKKVDHLLFEDDLFLFFADWLAFMAPSVDEASSVMQLCFWAETVKVVYVYRKMLKDSAGELQGDMAAGGDADMEAFGRAVEAMAAEDTRDPYAGIPLTQAQLMVLRVLVDRYALAFLRKCLIVMHIRYGLDFECPYDLDPSQTESRRLSRLLHVLSFDSLCGIYTSANSAGETLRTMTRQWIGQANMATEHTPASRGPAIRLLHPSILELVGLPKNYDTLTLEAIRRRCPTTGKDITDPAACLFCGAIFCSQAVCCMRDGDKGGCWQHMQRCGGKTGVFINIRKCMVLLLHGNDGSYLQAPYLDRHGEPDPTLRRHHQLFLNQRRYDKLLREVWLQQGVQTVISRKLEADINPGGWETL